MDEQQYEYRTGRTEPRRKHNGLIAFLLILIIFMAGLISALGLMNIRLFRLLEEKNEETPLSFAFDRSQPQTQTNEGIYLAGMNVQEISAAYQAVNHLPEGLYIASVQEGSYSHQKGILVGDVLVSLSGTPVTTLEELQSLLNQAPGPLTLTVCRDNQHVDYILEVGE